MGQPVLEKETILREGNVRNVTSLGLLWQRLAEKPIGAKQHILEGPVYLEHGESNLIPNGVLQKPSWEQDGLKTDPIMDLDHNVSVYVRNWRMQLNFITSCFS